MLRASLATPGHSGRHPDILGSTLTSAKPTAQGTDEMEQAQLIECLQEGDLPGALEVFKALDDKSEAKEILASIADQLEINDWDQLQLGLQLCDLVIPEEPEDSDVYVWRIKALTRLGRHDEMFEFARANKGRPEVLWELFERLCIHGKEDEATGLLGELGEAGTESVGDFYYNLGGKMLASAPLSALLLYRGAIACGSPLPSAHVNGGIAAIALRRYHDAIELARAGLELSPTEPNLWANLVDSLTHSGDEPGLRQAMGEARKILGKTNRCDDCDHTSQVAACAIGCGALLDDLMDAALTLGDAGAALDLYQSHDSGDARPESRITFTWVRTLAALGRHEDAHAVLDGGMSNEDAGSQPFYRARAAAAWAAGDKDRAVGALAAVLAEDYKQLPTIDKDPAIAAIENHPDFIARRRIRPPGVPQNAWFEDAWNDGDNEWVIGDKDDQDRLQGQVKYFRPDGTLCCACEHVDGKPHGSSTRYHPSGETSQTSTFVDGALHGTRTWIPIAATTTENTLAKGMSTDIVRIESDYDHGSMVAMRYFLDDDRQCAPDGTPLPDRPEGVPANALYNPGKDTWVHGTMNDQGGFEGPRRTYNRQGVLIQEAIFEEGSANGPFKAFFDDGLPSAVGEYEDGDRSGTWTFYLVDGEDHEDCPTAGRRVVKVEQNIDDDTVRFFGAGEVETIIDGTPVADMRTVHAELGDLFDQIESVDWSDQEDAYGQATSAPNILVGLLAQDDPDSEEVSDHVYGQLWSHLCHQGTVYSATAVALPFAIRIAAYRKAPFRKALLDFISACACHSAETIERAREEEWDDVLGCYRALIDGVDSVLGLLEEDDPAIRNKAVRLLSGAHEAGDRVAGALRELHRRDDSVTARGNILFSLARLGSDAGLELLDSSLDDDSLVGACAAMALVMARGQECGDEVLTRLVDEVGRADDERAEQFSELPWADDHLVAELGQALAYGGGGAPVLGRLIERFDDVSSLSALTLVQSAIRIAIEIGEGGLTPELRKVLEALVAADNPWQFNVNMHEILEGFGLPRGRDELRELLAD
ncbi:MAG: hypothetical protein KJO07_07995 [Deltaproteobacteria bacterium]|nr:hypothetical protein [Deltaproteobacteria bacterium]